MIDHFQPACAIIFGEEGPYSDARNDPGGETKWGVARNEHPEITDLQWFAWTQADSANLLRTKYWDAYRCGEMPWAWALAVFDGAVNQGSVISLAQLALGVAVDNVIGPATLAAMTADTGEKLELFLARRAQKYVVTNGYQIDGRGWLKRLFNVARMGAIRPA